MVETGSIILIHVLQDYILVLQDIIARQNGCSDFWDMKYDESLSNNLYSTAQEYVRNLEHTLNISAENYEYTDDMWFIELLRKHLTEYKFIFNVD